MVQLRLKRLQQEVAQYPQYFCRLTMQRFLNARQFSPGVGYVVSEVDHGIVTTYLPRANIRNRSGVC
ncbi:MAG: hypothetical protein ACJAWG_003469 [Candidatus Azotimanducaceae bacterium]|jgi:hypothetical protein